MTRALLDVNALLALLDDQHVDHGRVRRWLRDTSDGWATCAITQNGFVRIASQPRYSNPISTALALELLAEATADTRHEFWPCTVSVADTAVVDRSRVLGPGQVTDVYLLALAVARGGRLVTLDRTIAMDAVHRAASENLVVL